jgi:nucleoside-diphosphate-sugar epimerase
MVQSRWPSALGDNMAAGDRAAEQSRLAAERVRRLRRQLEQAERNARAWAMGSAGESLVEEEVQQLTSRGWLVLHDVHWPGRPKANLDHVLVGPGGVLVIDAKNWTGKVDLRDGVLRQNGYRRDREVAGVLQQSAALSALCASAAASASGYHRTYSPSLQAAKLPRGPAAFGAALGWRLGPHELRNKPSSARSGHAPPVPHCQPDHSDTLVRVRPQARSLPAPGCWQTVPMTVLLAGCGDLGTEAGLRFAAAGYPVVGWRRSPQNLPAAIEGTATDLSSGTLPPLPADTTAVVVAIAAGAPTEDAYRAAYVDGLANVLDAVEAGRERDGGRPGGVRRVLFVSSTAVYGDSGGDWIDESTTPAPGGSSGRIICEAEDLLYSRLRGTGITPVVLRLGGIYGPGRTRLIDQVRGGSAVPPAESFTNRIHRDDAAAAIVHLCTMDATPGPLYLGVDNEPSQLGEVLAFLAAELGLPQPPSDALPTGGSGAGGSASRAGGEPSRGGNKRCSNTLLRSTGFEPQYPSFREGYRAVLAGVGARHP